MADYFYSLQALVVPDTIDMPAYGLGDCPCVVCAISDEENQ